jgi:hypothetical protein
LEETAYWIELIHEASVGPKDQCLPLLRETAELKAIFSSIAINSSRGA